jgi:hypothetical protein
LLTLAVIGCDGGSRAEVARLKAESEATRTELAMVRAELEATKAAKPTYLDELERLETLRSKGALTDSEFEAKKQTLLKVPATTKGPIVVENAPPGLTVAEIAAQFKTLQELFQTNTLSIQEHNSKKSQLISKPIVLVDLKADLELVQKLFNDATITLQEYNQLKQKILEIDQTRVPSTK